MSDSDGVEEARADPRWKMVMLFSELCQAWENRLANQDDRTATKTCFARWVANVEETKAEELKRGKPDPVVEGGLITRDLLVMHRARKTALAEAEAEAETEGEGADQNAAAAGDAGDAGGSGELEATGELSAADLHQIVKWAGLTHAFGGVPPSDTKELFRDSVELREMRAGEPLFFQGELGESYWAVCTGKLALFILTDKSAERTKLNYYKEQEMEEVVMSQELLQGALGTHILSLSSGAGLGELSLLGLGGKNRACAAVAEVEGTAMLKVDAEAYSKFLANEHMRRLNLMPKLEFLQSIHYFASWERHNALRLAYPLKEFTFSRSSRLAAAGQAITQLMFIVDGSVELVHPRGRTAVATLGPKDIIGVEALAPFVGVARGGKGPKLNAKTVHLATDVTATSTVRVYQIGLEEAARLCVGAVGQETLQMLVEKALMERGFRKKHFHQMRRHQKLRRGGENLLHPTVKTDVSSPFQVGDPASSGGQQQPEAPSPTAVDTSSRSPSLPHLEELATSPVVRRHLQQKQYGGNLRRSVTGWFSPVCGDPVKHDECNWDRRRLPAVAGGSPDAALWPETGVGQTSRKLHLPPAVPVTPTTARKRLESRYRRECGALLTPSRKQRPNLLALQHGWASVSGDGGITRSASAQTLHTLGRTPPGASASDANGKALQRIHSQLERAALGSLGANAFTDHTRARKQREAEVSLPSHRYKRKGKHDRNLTKL